MKNLLAIVCLTLVSAAAMPQETTPVSPQDQLLDKLVGDWDATGLAHGNRYTWKMHGEWVLSHQFLHWTEKSTEDIVGVGRRFEVIYYFNFDDNKKQYIAHMLKNFGSEDSSILGFSALNGDHLAFVYKLPQETVTEQLIWKPTSKDWQLKSWGDLPDGKRIDILDVKITRSH